MKCVKCGNPIKENRIICPSCINTNAATKLLDSHKCRSFMQMKDSFEGVCQNVFLCEPIKKALKNESLFMRLGHVICPNASVNISYITNRDFTDKELEHLKKNYKECFE